MVFGMNGFNNEEKLRGYIYDKTHAMFTECPELWNHKDIIRQYLRLAYIDGANESVGLSTLQKRVETLELIANLTQDLVNDIPMKTLVELDDNVLDELMPLLQGRILLGQYKTTKREE